jgi:uncharacterized membrane protein YkvA (DUF1232 family)
VPNLLVLFRELLHDSRVPRGPKVWLGIAIVWIASPVDVIPEFVPIAGPLDDAIVAALVLRHLLRRTPREVVREHWQERCGRLRRPHDLGGRSPCISVRSRASSRHSTQW